MSIPSAPLDPTVLTLTGRHALFLDFDGTLAPLQDNPDTVALPEHGAKYLLTLSDRLGGALVLISGRGIHDLSLRTPLQLWRAGGHGHDVCQPGQHPELKTGTAPEALREAVEAATREIEGAWLEEKGRVLAIHYRQIPAAGPGLAKAMKILAQETEGYAFQHGKMVIELKPSGADKGTALTALMRRSPFAARIPVMIGDDATDEDAMTAAMELGGIGIKVGLGKTCAQYRFTNTDAVWRWLKEQSSEHT